MKRMLSSLFALVLATLFTTGIAFADQRERVLIRAAKPYDALVARIQAVGGRVTHQYKNFEGIAAEIPSTALGAITNLVGADAVTKDVEIPNPAPVDTPGGRTGLQLTGEEKLVSYDGAQSLQASDIAALAGASPNAYRINNQALNVAPLHAGGVLGQGVVVAVIDSGIRPGFPHISLDGSVIGCEDFVGDALGCSNFGNNGHGTFVAGMISANVAFGFSAGSSFRNAVLTYCPGCFTNPPTNTVIPMIGTAPLSSIYAFRVFGPSGGGPTSVILAAVDRVVELRKKFDAGDATGVKIEVCNMSLGGSTLFPGQDLFDTAVQAVLDAGIVLVISAGNAGPSSITVGSPGTSYAALTVGASSDATHERILRQLQLPSSLGPLRGALYRPSSGTQTAVFSSRGPNADGRTDPEVVANGDNNFGQGFSSTVSGISIGSGTSFSAPSVAGVAALLRQAFPNATARQIRNAIILSANPSFLSDGSTVLDQGSGYVNAQAAYNLLAGGNVPDTLPPPPNPNKQVKNNVEKNTFLNVRDGLVIESFAGLKPGQRQDILYRVHPNTSQVIVQVTGVTPALPPAQQNQLFGDDVLLTVHSAKTSAIGQGDYPVFAFTTGGMFVVDNPELGIMRITVNGDWTNAGDISGNVAIFSVTEPLPQKSSQGKVSQSDLLIFPVQIASGTSAADFRLEWRADWGDYPTNDLDLFLVNPNGVFNSAGASLNNPERVIVNNPIPGTWLVLVNGFEVHTGDDKFELRVALDGKVVKIK